MVLKLIYWIKFIIEQEVLLRKFLLRVKSTKTYFTCRVSLFSMFAVCK